MAFADPQSVTISGYNGGVAVSLPRTSSGVTGGGFTAANGEINMTVSNSYGKRTRRVIRLNQKKTTADALIPSQNVVLSQSCYLVIDAPVNGFSTTEQKALVDSLTAFLAASTGAKVTQLVGGEN